MIKFSQNKIILLAIAVFAVLAVWFLVVVPNWHTSIKNKIQAANYCEVDSDCKIDYFNSFTCGSYINKNEGSDINMEIKLYRLLSFDIAGCNGWYLPQPTCKNKQCERGVDEY